MAMTTKPLGETMAAEVTGVDLAAPVGDELARALNRALVDHLVLCIRDQDLTPAQYGAASHLFGSPKPQVLRSTRLEDAPEVKRVQTHRLEAAAAVGPAAGDGPSRAAAGRSAARRP